METQRDVVVVHQTNGWMGPIAAKVLSLTESQNIFLYVPNVIGYVRLALLVLSFWFMNNSPLLFFCLYCCSILLDGFDGYAARKLNQVTAFGAWLDVAIDNLSRAMLWFHVSQFGWLVSSIEWTVFVCTHTLGQSWKSGAQAPPMWVQAVMENGFKTPVGAYAIIGLHCLPIWFYLQKTRLFVRKIAPCAQAYVTLGLGTGRLLCMSVEIWFIYMHILDMAAVEDHDPKPVEQPHQPDKNINQTTKRPIKNVNRRRAPIANIPAQGSTMINMAYTSQGKEKPTTSSPTGRRHRRRDSSDERRRSKSPQDTANKKGRRRSPRAERKLSDIDVTKQLGEIRGQESGRSPRGMRKDELAKQVLQKLSGLSKQPLQKQVGLGIFSKKGKEGDKKKHLGDKDSHIDANKKEITSDVNEGKRIPRRSMRRSSTESSSDDG